MLLPMLAASAAGTMLAGALNSPGKKKPSADGNNSKGRPNRLFETLTAACLLMLVGCALETTAEPTTDGAIEPKVLGFLAFIGLGFGMSAAGATMLAGMEAPMWEHGEFWITLSQLTFNKPPRDQPC